MKKTYVAPDVEIQEYVLSASIANNCENKPTFGPASAVDPSVVVCDDIFGDNDPFAIGMLGVPNAVFYPDSCDCQYSALSSYFSS